MILHGKIRKLKWHWLATTYACGGIATKNDNIVDTSYGANDAAEYHVTIEFIKGEGI